MPEALDILQILADLNLHKVTLLAVSGKEWTEREVNLLRAFQQAGYELAGHGWKHHCDRVTTFTHQLHSAVLSGPEAEHLAFRQQQIYNLLARSFGWFQEVGLQYPNLDVPPAWAMGKISRQALQQLPFALYESLTGIAD